MHFEWATKYIPVQIPVEMVVKWKLIRPNVESKVYYSRSVDTCTQPVQVGYTT